MRSCSGRGFGPEKKGNMAVYVACYEECNNHGRGCRTRNIRSLHGACTGLGKSKDRWLQAADSRDFMASPGNFRRIIRQRDSPRGMKAAIYTRKASNDTSCVVSRRVACQLLSSNTNGLYFKDWVRDCRTYFTVRSVAAKERTATIVL